jgi:hypothetical protein
LPGLDSRRMSAWVTGGDVVFGATPASHAIPFIKGGDVR